MNDLPPRNAWHVQSNMGRASWRLDHWNTGFIIKVQTREGAPIEEALFLVKALCAEVRKGLPCPKNSSTPRSESGKKKTRSKRRASGNSKRSSS